LKEAVEFNFLREEKRVTCAKGAKTSFTMDYTEISRYLNYIHRD
jgi:hypothetical protein